MSTILPKGEGVRRAVKWISEQLQSEPASSPIKFLPDAIARFDLSPKEGDELFQFYKQASGSGA